MAAGSDSPAPADGPPPPDVAGALAPGGELVIDFSADGNSAAYVGTGWGDVERRWTWVVGPLARLRVPVAPGMRGLTCRVALIPFLSPPYHNRQRLTVLAGGHQVFAAAITENTEISFAVPRHAVGEAALQLEFHCLDAIAPVVVGGGGDVRALGVAVPRITLAADADSGAPALGGLAEPAFKATRDPAALIGSGEPVRLRLFETMAPPAQAALVGEAGFEADFVAEHYRYPAPPDVDIYALSGATLRGNGLVTLGDRFVLNDDCYPRYFRGYVKPDGHDFIPAWIGGDAPPVVERRVEGAIGVAMHPNIVYGHFLLECVPRLFQIALLREQGLPIRVPLGNRMPSWVGDFVRLYLPDAEIIPYDIGREVLRADRVVIPSMMHIEGNFHPAFNLVVNDLMWRAGVRARPEGAPAGIKVYLSRRNLRPGWHRMTNEEEVEREFTRLGFRVVHPERLLFADQVALMASADVIAGPYGSALHNALFARRGTRILALNCINWYQSAIARLRGHRVAYVPPADGRFRTWRTRTQGEGEAEFAIDPAAIAPALAALEAAA